MAMVMSFMLFSSAGNRSASADTISDLEAKQEALEKQKKKVEQSLKASEGKVEEIEQYLQEYDEKMHIQEEQIAVINEQLALYQSDIDELTGAITVKEEEVQTGIETFRQRLRVLYISGNDSLASVLTGATDFFDMLARMEFFERISKHDNDMIENLNNMISDLNTDKASLEEKFTEMEQKKAEEELYYAELKETYNNHAETKQMQEKMIADYEARYDEIIAEDDKLEKEIQAEIRRQQEEAERRRKEEEERRRKEEEERKKAAEAKGEDYTEKDTRIFESYSDTGFIWPVPTVRNMTDGYGSRWIVEESRNDTHKGIDITKPGCYGEPIIASAAGEVLTAGNTYNGYGNHVVIDHGNKVSTLYGHCSSLAVKAGDIVKQGQVIGYIGSTGYAYGNHLHFEVRLNGQHTNPLNYVNISN